MWRNSIRNWTENDYLSTSPCSNLHARFNGSHCTSFTSSYSTIACPRFQMLCAVLCCFLMLNACSVLLQISAIYRTKSYVMLWYDIISCYHRCHLMTLSHTGLMSLSNNTICVKKLQSFNHFNSMPCLLFYSIPFSLLIHICKLAVSPACQRCRTQPNPIASHRIILYFLLQVISNLNFALNLKILKYILFSSQLFSS